MKIKILLLLTSIFVFSCKDEAIKIDNIQNSIIIEGNSLILIDSIQISSYDSKTIGSILHGYILDDFFLLPDSEKKSVHIFDNKFNYIKEIGRKGRGPGEFATIPVIVQSHDSLRIVNMMTKKIHLYNEKFDFYKEEYLPKSLYYHYFNPIKNGSNYVFSCAYPMGINRDQYYEDYKSLTKLNRFYEEIDNFFAFNDIYRENATIAYARNNFGNLLTLGKNGHFFSIQIALYMTTLFDSDCTEILTFGRKPKYYKSPPIDISFEKTQNSYEMLMDFKSKTTIISKISYDRKTDYFFLAYTNPQKEAYIKRDNQLFEKYLMVYNERFECVYDEKISGNFLFSYRGIIHILEQPRENTFIIKKYELKKQ